MNKTLALSAIITTVILLSGTLGFSVSNPEVFAQGGPPDKVGPSAGLLAGIQAQIDALSAALTLGLAGLQTQIDNIQLTPGPQGPQGPAGADGTGGTGLSCDNQNAIGEVIIGFTVDPACPLSPVAECRAACVLADAECQANPPSPDPLICEQTDIICQEACNQL